MHILAIDVSVTVCSVGVLDTATSAFYSKKLETDKGQAEFLVPMVQDVIILAGINIKNLDYIAVTRGPGSFTGVRIGLATAKMLGLALHIPVIGISTLDVIARMHSDSQDTLFLIDTKRNDFYGQIGEGSPPKIWTVDDVNHHKGPHIKDIIPDILTLAYMAIEQHDGTSVYNLQRSPTPLYLRDAEVSQPKNTLSVR